MTRTTTLLGAAFLVTSVTLTIMNKSVSKPADSLMQDGRTKDGIPTKGIDLSVPTAPTNAIAPIPAAPAGGIPASAPSAPQPVPLFPATPAAPATEPTPAEKK
jgi:preprotein translocase subunit SecG